MYRNQYAGGVAEQRVGGLAATAHVGLVHHVVVQQGGGVDEFDHRSQLEQVLVAVTQRAAGQQRQHRTQAFAAGRDDVLGYLADQDNIGVQALADGLIDRVHVAGYKRAEVRGRRHRDRVLYRNWLENRAISADITLVLPLPACCAVLRYRKN